MGPQISLNAAYNQIKNSISKSSKNLAFEVNSVLRSYSSLNLQPNRLVICFNHNCELGAQGSILL